MKKTYLNTFFLLFIWLYSIGFNLFFPNSLNFNTIPCSLGLSKAQFHDGMDNLKWDVSDSQSLSPGIKIEVTNINPIKEDKKNYSTYQLFSFLRDGKCIFIICIYEISYLINQQWYYIVLHHFLI